MNPEQSISPTGEEKKNLQVADLLKKFADASEDEFANDRMLLSQ